MAADRRTVVLAVDLGGTKVEAALVDDSAVLAETRIRRSTGPASTPESLKTAIVEVVRHALERLPAGKVLTGVGIASAGPINAAAGSIAPVNLPGVRDFPLRDTVSTVVAGAGVPVRLGHDGGCLALAESRYGSTCDANTSLTFVVSTGIGGGIVHRGALFMGSTGNAGHLGQVIATPEGDTLENIASGPSTVRWARSQGWRGTTGEHLAEAVAEGNAIARAAIERSASAVGQAVASLAALCDLDAVAIGGGFSKVAPDYVALVASTFRDSVALPHLRDLRITATALDDEGPLMGAATLARA